MIEKLRKKPEIIYFSGILLLIIALLINLGKLNIFMAVDEATRALVALEMMIRENFITSTINGEFYYNKPPLFPWILVAFYKVFGISELVLRLPTVISLIGFGFTIYYFVSKELGKQAGLIVAFLFVTSGRLLFWESLLGYIDTTFSWVIYSGLMFIIYYFRQKKFLHLFIISYFFMSLGFMLKGLPAIVFQGITLLVVFISEKEFKRLFSWQHVLGAMVFIILVGAYYLAYHQYNSLENVFSTLWSESTNRTVATQGIGLTLKHLYIFPTEMLYHYLPWTLLIVFTFVKGFWSTIFRNKFLKLNLLVLLFNLIPYWTSPDVYPKYIMMLIPMALTVFVYFYLQNKRENKKASQIIEMIFLFAATALSLGYLAFPFIPQFQETSLVILKSLALFGLSAFLVFLFWKIKSQRLILFAIILIVGRMAFGLFVWPQRAPQYEKFEEYAVEVARITGDESLYYYHAPMLQYGSTYVMSREKWDIIRHEENSPTPDTFYITDDEGLEMIKKNHADVKIFYSYPNVEDGRTLNLIKITE